MTPTSKLIAIASDLGYRVEFVAQVRRCPFDKEPIREGFYCAGYTDYERRTIQVAPDNDAGMFFVLAHEVGHALAAHRMGIDRLPARKRRRAKTGEARAYLYGWAVLRSLGVAPEPITRELWRDEHRDIVPGLAP